ncbi:MAG TPA: cation:proton antiporter [Polyangiaceae bacterium]|nr:cation:proton antiporter [Polyangiaceae bacterium]
MSPPPSTPPRPPSTPPPGPASAPPSSSPPTSALAAKGLSTRLLQGGLLLLFFGLLYGVSRAAPHPGPHGGTAAALGFLLLAGTLASELLEPLRLPHLTGYMAAGVLAGPHVLHLIDHGAVDDVSSVNALALSLIALAGGAELKVDVIRRSLRGLSWAMALHSTLGFAALTGVFYACRSLMPFVRPMAAPAAFGVALLWGALAVSRSPSATLAILSQTRASGPLARHTLAFVMTSDVVVLAQLALTTAAARPLLEPGSTFSTAELGSLGYEMLGSVAIGTALGLVLALYLRLIGQQLLLVLIALGFGATEVLRYLHFDAMLTFVVAGFVVQNLSQQGDALLRAVGRTAGLVFVVFFATAGAHLDLPLLRKLWPVALILVSSRVVVTWALARASAALAREEPLIRHWGWSGLVSQAGLTLGMSLIIERSFPAFGAPFRALAIAAVAFNEVLGPILFKYALDRAGETGHAQARPGH